MKQLILICFIVFSFASCKKTDEANTLLGEWRVDSYKENGTDQTTVFKAAYANYLIKFDASNNFIETYTFAGTNVTKAGEWTLTNDGEDYELVSQVDSSTRYFHIIELNPESASVSEENGTKEYHLLKD